MLGAASQNQSSGRGNIRIKFHETDQIVNITECLYVPEMGVNLSSLGALREMGLIQSSTKKAVRSAISSAVPQRQKDRMMHETHHRAQLTDIL
jgi:hypothetical protein